MAVATATLLMTDYGGSGHRGEGAWRWVCRFVGAALLGLLVLEQGFKGAVGLYFLFTGLMTLGDVIGEAMRLRRDVQELRDRDGDR
jgi:hypothetical protein